MAHDLMREAYGNQKRRSKGRGIPFLITFEDWRDWWLVDDRWSKRGLTMGSFVMARKEDVGPYSLENIYCATNSQNQYDIPQSVRLAAGKKAVCTTRARGNAYTHLRSEVHHRRIAIRSPEREFGSIEEAARHYGVSSHTIRYRLGRWEGWQRVKPDTTSLNNA